MALVLAGLVVVTLAFLNAWVTRAVVKDTLSSQPQKIAQIAFVWLVPLFGALLTIHSKRTLPEPSTGSYREAPDAGDDFALSTQGFRKMQTAIESDTSTSGESGSGD